MAQTVVKAWGYEQIICNTEHYCSKFLHVAPGQRCSLHFHHLKDETFYILDGICILEIGGATRIMQESDWQRISPGTRHRFSSEKGCIILETSTHHEDQDVVRLEPSGAMELTPT